MRVLLISPAAPTVYWSLPNLCKVSGARALMPPLGLLTVAALLPQEWQFRVKDVAARAVTEDDWVWADLVMLGGMISQQDSLMVSYSGSQTEGQNSGGRGPSRQRRAP